MSDGPAYGIGHNQLAALAADIRSLHAGIRRGAEQIARDAIEAGRQLLEAKSLVRHGEWELWLRDNVDISPRTARLYMQLSRSGLKTAAIADLGLAGAARAVVGNEARTRCVQRPGRRALSACVEVGQLLITAKADLGDDHFPRWVEDEFGWIGPEAEQYIAIARAHETGNWSGPLELVGSALLAKAGVAA
jgi:hypothetical protein